MEEGLTTETRSSIILLPGIVDQPLRTLSAVVATPRRRWILPAVLSILAFAALLVVSFPYLAEQAELQQALAIQQLESQMGDLTESQRADAAAMIGNFSSPTVLAATEFLRRTLGLFLGWLVGTAILHFGMQVGGRDTRFDRVLAGYAWTTLPFVLGDLVNAGWILFARKLSDNPGLSYFFATGDVIADGSDLLWNLSSKLDLFWLWHVVLVYVLTRATGRRGGKLGLTIIYAVAMLLLRALPPVLGGSLALGTS